MEDGGPKSYLIDMDGVLVHGDIPIPGATEFIGRLVQRQARFLILTNNSLYTPRDLQLRFDDERRCHNISFRFPFLTSVSARPAKDYLLPLG